MISFLLRTLLPKSVHRTKASGKSAPDIEDQGTIVTMVMDSHQTKMDLAGAAHRAGRVGEAKRLLEEIVASSPAHGPALNSLGLIALGEGDLRAAVTLLGRAAAADPKAAPVWLNLAEAHRVAQDSAEQIKVAIRRHDRA